MTRNAPVQTSLLIPAAIRVAMRAADASTASTSATYLETVLPEGHESVFMEIPMDKSSEMEMRLEHGHHHEHHHRQHHQHHHQEATGISSGKINDELRFSIIDAVYLRPAIWDHGRELRNLGQRKDHFIEIAALLSTEDNILSCHDIEKQWKNLKDSYFKLRKKVKIDASGSLVQPRWKYFSAMMFLDRLANSNYCAVPEVSTSGAHVISDASTILLDRDPTILGKRTVDRTMTASTAAPSRRRLDDGQCRIETTTSSTSSNTVDGQPSSVSTIFAPEDEYSSFCSSLIYPLREIGSMNRLEYVKLQKVIRDAIHEKQMELLQAETGRH